MQPAAFNVARETTPDGTLKTSSFLFKSPINFNPSTRLCLSVLSGPHVFDIALSV